MKRLFLFVIVLFLFSCKKKDAPFTYTFTSHHTLNNDSSYISYFETEAGGSTMVVPAPKDWTHTFTSDTLLLRGVSGTGVQCVIVSSNPADSATVSIHLNGVLISTNTSHSTAYASIP
jgi:hypothetical protein